MRNKIVAGNWKMNTTLSEAVALADGIKARINEVPQDVKVIIAPPFVNIYPVTQVVAGTKVEMAAQNCADKASGAYTGEVAAAMLTAVGCKYVILGHSERRQYYHECAETLCPKIELALQNGLTPIYCVGENLTEREAGEHFAVVEKQLKDVVCKLSTENFKNVIVAYEPVWAIGTGKTASKEQAQEIHEHIRKVLREAFGAQADDTSILYGGSCKPSNAKELFSMPDVDGGLIGGAALKAGDFIELTKSF